MSEEQGIPTRRVLMMRHGHYDRVGDLGDEHWGLSALGRRQAARTARRLVRLVDVEPRHFEGLYSSPWPRALQTAEIAAHELGLDRVRVKPYLHEAIPLVPATPADGVPVHPDLPPSTAEERELTIDQIQRITARFFKASKHDATDLVFCHGNLIRYLMCSVLGLPYEAWMRIDCHHASITEFRVYPGGFVALICYNDTGHLPPDLVTS